MLKITFDTTKRKIVHNVLFFPFTFLLVGESIPLKKIILIFQPYSEGIDLGALTDFFLLNIALACIINQL